MIAATGIELRAGSRLLLDDATFRIAAGDRVGLVGRNGAGKTTLTKVLAGEAAAGRGHGDPLRRGRLPARRTRAPATSTSSPATASCPPAGWTQSCASCARPRARWPAPTTRPATRRCAATAASRPSSPPGAATPPRPRPPRSPRSLGLPERVLGQPLRDPVRRPAPPGRAGPDPVLAARETLLLDEPTNHLDADSIVWLRDFLKAYKGGLVVISHDVGLLEAVGQPGVPPRRQPGRARHLQRRLEALPAAARDRRAAPQARARQRREEGRHAAWPRPTRCGPRPPRPRPRRTWPSGPSGCWPGSRTSGSATRSPSCASPSPAPCGKTPLTARGAVEVLRLAGDLHRRRPGHRPGHPGRRPRPQRRGQDHAAAPAGRRRAARHRRGGARARAEARLLRPGARDARRRPHGAGEHAVRGAGPRRHRGAQGARLVPVLRRRRGQARRRALRRGEDPAGAGHAGGVRGQRAAARRADQQPRPGQPRGGPRRAADLRGRGRPGHATTRARSRRSSRSGCCSCPTASRTSGPDYVDLVALA